MTLTRGQNLAKSIGVPLSPWYRTLIPLALLMAWTLYLYRHTAVAMASIWASSETFNHAFLVPPIVLWLIWRRRQAIANEVSEPAVGFLFLVALAAFVWFLGDLVAVNAVAQLAFVGMLVLAIPALLGWSVTRLVLFPLGFAFFAVPIGEFFMPQLMEWTANFAIFALRLTGIPVYREGLQFVIPSGSWSVVEACSGVRYLIASVTVGTLFAYLNFRSTKRRLLFVLISFLVPVVANWMRAYLIVLLGHFSGNKLAAGIDHLIYGWVFFGVVILVMFSIGGRWAEHEKVTSKVESCTATGTPVSFVKLWTVAAGFAMLVATPYLLTLNVNRIYEEVDRTLAPVLDLNAGWEKVNSSFLFKPQFQHARAEVNDSYAKKNQIVGLYLGYYSNQDYKHKLVSSSNVLASNTDSHWAPVSSRYRTVGLGNASVEVRSSELRGATLSGQLNPPRLVVWQLYWINGTLTASDYLAKLYGAFHRLTGRGDSSAVIVLYTSKLDSSESKQGELESFLSDNYAAINKLLVDFGKNMP